MTAWSHPTFYRTAPVGYVGYVYRKFYGYCGILRHDAGVTRIDSDQDAVRYSGIVLY